MTAVRAKPATPEAYVREARRLRARHARQPARLAAELRKLSTPAPTSPVPARTSVPPPQVAPAPLLRVPAATAHTFATEVELALLAADGVLRYSARQTLLARARQLRIAPFEANLLIASVLHHHRPAPAPPTTSPWPKVLLLAGVALAALLLLALA